MSGLFGKKYNSESEFVDSSPYESKSGKKYNIDIIKGGGFPFKRQAMSYTGPYWYARHEVHIVDAEKDKEIVCGYTRTSPFVFTGKLTGRKLIEKHEAKKRFNESVYGK